MSAVTYSVDSSGLVYSFSRHHPPRLRVPDGSRLEIETCDCFENQIRRPEDTLASLDWDRINPATGPIFVEGAEPGDVLAALLEQGRLIRLGDDVLLLAETYEEMREAIVAHLREHGTVTVAQVRDMFGTSRKYVLALLGYLDEKRITRRVGDERVLR